MPALISLRDRVDKMLQCISSRRDIRTPFINCRQRGMTAPAAPSHGSVRASILALRRFDMASQEARAPERSGPQSVTFADGPARE